MKPVSPAAGKQQQKKNTSVREGDSHGGGSSGSWNRLKSVQKSAWGPPAFMPDISCQSGNQVQYWRFLLMELYFFVGE